MTKSRRQRLPFGPCSVDTAKANIERAERRAGLESYIRKGLGRRDQPWPWEKRRF
jgi:hypothetical protein